jgi:hypothetical protein
MVNQNVKETLKKFQDNKNREFEKEQKSKRNHRSTVETTKVKQRTRLINR